MKAITVRSPATIANLVCGFDVLGLCLHEPYDEMEVRLIPEKRVVISPPPGYDLPADPARNSAGAPLIEMIKNLEHGFEVRIKKNIKPGSGLGSSAASATGAVVAANLLTGSRLSNTELVQLAMFGEKAASGVKHADNVAPGIYGGITLVRNMVPLDIVPLPAPELFVTIVHPLIEIKTIDARQILRKELLLKDAIKQWGNIAGLVTGIIQNDYDLIGRSMEDHIIEPVRSILIPGFDKVKKRCREVGVIGGGIAGSGPSLFMISRHEATARQAEEVMKDVYNELGLDYNTYVTTINHTGCTVIE